MAFHLAARTHAFIHGLFQPSDERLTRELYDRTYRTFSRHELQTEEGREKLRNGLLRDLLDAFGLDVEHPQFGPLYELVTGVLEYENLFVLPEVDWTLRRSVTEYWELRDELNEQLALIENFDATRYLLLQSLRAIVGTVYDACPALLERPGGNGVPAPTTLIRSLGEPGAVTETVLSVAADEELKDARLYLRCFDRLERNLVAASGGNPNDPGGFNRAPKMPTKSDIADPAELVATYLSGRPILPFFDQHVLFQIPTKARFEHHHIVAGSGHGKTQTLQYLIGRDLETVADGNRSVVSSIARAT